MNNEYSKRTLDYYSMWLGENGVLFQNFSGIKYIYSEARNRSQYGYGRPFDMYIFIMVNKIVVSYGDKAKAKMSLLKDLIDASKSVEDIKSYLKTIYGKDSEHNVKYVFNGSITDDCKAKVLGKNDYDEYEDFFKKCNFNCDNLDWLQEYFEEMTNESLCFGVYEDGMLVSCTDVPIAPYMSNEVQEIGINTLPDYRNRGYATIACQCSINEILKKGKVPQWSTSITNIASQKLAQKLNFVKFGEVITMSI